MEAGWAVVTIAPVFLIAVGGHRLLVGRWRLHPLASGFLCGATAGIYLFGVGELAFRFSVTALLPGALFHAHTFAFAMLSVVADKLVRGGDTMILHALVGSRVARLLWAAGTCAVGYGLLGVLLASLVNRVRGRRR